MIIRAAITRGLQAQALELGRDVLGGELASSGSGPPAFQGVVGQELEVGS
jgi:hypothetical protein